MTKDFFLKSGKYDEEMEIWGPDNVELSLRVSLSLGTAFCTLEVLKFGTKIWKTR